MYPKLRKVEKLVFNWTTFKWYHDLFFDSQFSIKPIDRKTIKTYFVAAGLLWTKWTVVSTHLFMECQDNL